MCGNSWKSVTALLACTGIKDLDLANKILLVRQEHESYRLC